MWADCFEVFVNLEKVDYIAFGMEQDGQLPTCYVYFTGRPEPLKLHASTVEEMIEYFSELTVGERVSDE
jgi:hypothetical protein